MGPAPSVPDRRHVGRRRRGRLPPPRPERSGPRRAARHRAPRRGRRPHRPPRPVRGLDHAGRPAQLAEAPHPRLVARAITRPLKIRPEAVLGVTFPAGRVPTESWAGSLRTITGPDWPEDPLWICSVRMDDKRAASCSAARARRSPTWPLPSRRRRRSRLNRWRSTARATWTAASTRRPTADVVRKEDLDLVLM